MRLLSPTAQPRRSCSLPTGNRSVRCRVLPSTATGTPAHRSPNIRSASSPTWWREAEWSTPFARRFRMTTRRQAFRSFSSHVDAVQLTVTVVDGGEHFVQGLPQSAFHVREDGTPQSISSFVSEDIPLELVVAIDVSASMTPAMPKLKATVKEFLAAVPAPNSITLLAFNDRIMPLATPATSAADRTAAIDSLTAYGGTSFYDVVIRGVDLVLKRPGRKAMIVFTDGEDQGSQASLDQVERRLQTSDVTPYLIGEGRGVELKTFRGHAAPGSAHRWPRAFHQQDRRTAWSVCGTAERDFTPVSARLRANQR